MRRTPTIGLNVPLDVIRAETAPYRHRGKPIRRTSPGHDQWHAAGAEVGNMQTTSALLAAMPTQ
jgi:hypothetical protein